ncbi:hypothetical protein K458DRAFT_306843 [Lentithecium fluviatile CBS 122367]|uniref:Heterokaryon incompatibility domain-containing protein n=1 Tax=Lentithecium fluviatile CBS 122367 TaxID=1168545 RepID=A0A6G1IXH5_9PLEO|nr:hypothetical protein K458DRAFT_306843 [Lentithecium fluviatile CBS 122367]
MEGSSIAQDVIKIAHEPVASVEPDTTSAEGSAGVYAYTPLTLSLSQIRILAVRHAPNFHDPIIADLETVSLDEDGFHRPSYTALSYCWGAPVMDGAIVLGGCRFPVTRSLEVALRYLRTHNGEIGDTAGGTRHYWIDQICINQKDICERGAQVGLMRRIYKRAFGVHVWLGDEADDSDTAMDILTTLGAPPRHAPGEKAIQYPRFTEADVEQHWKAIDAFFKRPWWKTCLDPTGNRLALQHQSILWQQDD